MINKVLSFLVSQKLFFSIVLLSASSIIATDAEKPDYELKNTLEVSNKRLIDAGGDHKKLGALAVSFVAKINGLEVDSDFWPQIESFIKDLDAKFTEAATGKENPAKVSEAIDELKKFLKQGQEAFSSTESSSEPSSESPKSKTSKETEEKTPKPAKAMQVGQFDLDDFVLDAKDDCKLVSDAEEFKFIAESMSEIMQEKKLSKEETVKFVEFLSENFTPLAVEHGVDAETKSMLVKLYQKFGADLPELKLLPKVNARTPEDDTPVATETQPEKTDKKSSAVEVSSELKKHLLQVFAKVKSETVLPERTEDQDWQKYAAELQTHIATLHENYSVAIKNL